MDDITQSEKCLAMLPCRFLSAGPEETRALAVRLAQHLKPGSVLALHGGLGSGKTCFVQGLARALEVSQPVSSPTFKLINEYMGRCPLIHMDLYRIESPAEMMGLDFDCYLETDGIVAIEWAENAGGWLPANTLHVLFEPGISPQERWLTISTEPPPADSGRI